MESRDENDIPHKEEQDYSGIHESQGSAPEEEPQPFGVPHRGRVPDGPPGRRDVQRDARHDARTRADEPQHLAAESDTVDGASAHSLSFAAHLTQNHLHLPILTPDQEVMERMKKNTPELYDAYVESIRTQVRSDAYVREARYREPAKYTRRGQVAGLIAVFAVLALAAFVFYLGHPLAGGIIAGIDVVALAAVFGGNQGSKRLD